MGKLLIMASAMAFQAVYAQVNLGGVAVPKDKFVVFLFIGHSNMAGRDINHSDPVTHPRAWNYHWMSDKQWVLAKETPGALANGLSGRGCGGGGMPLLKALAGAYPSHYIGTVDNASLSGTCKGSIDNNSSGMPGDSNRYWKGSQLYNEITNAAKEVRKTATLGGIFCMLGAIEATRSSETICRSFSDDLKQMVTDMRTEIGEPNLPFIMGEYEAGATGIYALTKPWPKIVDEQIKLLPGKLSQCALVPSLGVEMLDDHHYTATVLGHGEWAKRAVEVVKSRNWFPGVVSVLPPRAKTDLHLVYANGSDGPFLLLYPSPRQGTAPSVFVNALGRSELPWR